MLKGKKKKAVTGIALCVVVAIAGIAFMGMAAPGGMPEMEQTSQKTVVETRSPVRGGIAVTGSYVVR